MEPDPREPTGDLGYDMSHEVTGGPRARRGAGLNPGPAPADHPGPLVAPSATGPAWG